MSKFKIKLYLDNEPIMKQKFSQIKELDNLIKDFKLKFKEKR